jgi:hypothetical protein
LFDTIRRACYRAEGDVGQVANLRRIGNPPARVPENVPEVLVTAGSRRIHNPQQVDNLPHRLQAFRNAENV